MTTAAALQAIVAADPANPLIAPTVRWLMLRRAADAWPSTRDTAWVVAALADVIRTNPELSAMPSGNVVVRLNGVAVQTTALTPEMLREPEIVVRAPKALIRPGKNEVRIEREGSGRVFYTVEARQTIPGVRPQSSAPEAVRIRREWIVLRPKRSAWGEITMEAVKTAPNFRAGDRVRVRLILEAPKDLAYVLIKEPLPAGCEVSERGSADEVVEWGYWWSGIDVRDDHIAFFATSLSAGKSEIEYNLRAKTPGTYRALPTFLQAMYDPSTRADGLPDAVVVRP